jgi:hypothetical protein
LLGALAERFWRADGWRRLGYVSERQYARERLGMSLSSVKAKRVLARRSERMPAVVGALERCEIGFESALLVTRIATPRTIDAWLGRARRRTVKLLREEVEVAEIRIRLGGARDQLPPNDQGVRELGQARLETTRTLGGSSQMSGTPFRRQARALLDRMSQMSGVAGRREIPRKEAAIGSQRGFGRVTLRFSISEDTRDLWRGFEECFASVAGFLPTGVTAVGFLCATFHLVWGHTVDPQVAYAAIYARDGFECQNPTCRRRDVTPHHLKYRSAGGADDEENLISLCVWCHLFGVHEGRIRARPPASRIRWEIGRTPVLVIEGRDVVDGRV